MSKDSKKTFRKLAAPSLKEIFVREIEDMILSGKLEIGDQLPPERDLAEEMDISRTVITAGISELVSKGFLEIRPRIGTFVADYSHKGNLDTLSAIMTYNRGALGENEIRSILELRLVMETHIFKLLIPSCSDETLSVIRSKLEIIQAASDMYETSEACFDFSHTLSCLCDNTIVPLIFYSFKTPCVELYLRSCRLYGCESLKKRYEKLFSYIEARDLDGAVECLTEYLQNAADGSTRICGID